MNIEQLSKPWGELALYHRYATDLFSGKIPYKDFFPEYPPLSLTFFKLPLAWGSEYYMLAYYGLVALFVFATIFLIKKLKGNPWAFVASILPLGGLFWDRFDIFPAFFSLLAIGLTIPFLSGVALALGFATKIYPLMFLPLIFLRDRKMSFIWGFLITCLVIFLPVIQRGGGFNKLTEFHGKRGTHLESLRATPLLIKHLKGEIELETVYSHNTFELVLK